MVFQKSPPRLGWWLGFPTRHQVGNRSFGNLNTELEQLSMNSGSTPKRIGLYHPANKITDLRADRRPPGPFCRDLNFQNSLKPFRCHRMTVSGLTMISASCQLVQKWESKIQKRRSRLRSRGRLIDRLIVTSCWRSAMFSSVRS